jgi:hypothetical protein
VPVLGGGRPTLFSKPLIDFGSSKSSALIDLTGERDLPVPSRPSGRRRAPPRRQIRRPSSNLPKRKNPRKAPAPLSLTRRADKAFWDLIDTFADL